MSEDIATVEIEPGERSLRVSNGDENRDYVFHGTQLSQTMPPVTCSISPKSNDLTVQALLRGTLHFAIESFAPLENLELTVEIEANNRRISATSTLGVLPCLVFSKQEPFKSLLDDETRAILAKTPSLTVRLSVGHLCSFSVVLEQRLRLCWWQQAEDGTIALKSELGDLPIGWIPATDPTALPVPDPENLPDEACLLAPINLDISEYGSATQFATFCIAPSRTKLQKPAIDKPRFTRRLRAEDGALGIEDIVERFLRWSLAECTTIIAEMHRRRATELLDGWLTEICCGTEWARREAELVDGDFWESLLNECETTGIARDSYVELSSEEVHDMNRMAVRNIRLEFPDLLARRPSRDLSPEDYEKLDIACGQAYEELSQIYRDNGKDNIADRIGAGDPGAAPDQWNSVLENAISATEYHSLAELLLPTDSVGRLMMIEPSLMTLDELTEELVGWARKSRKALAGNEPSVETFRTILALWIEPEAAANLDLRDALDVLLAERSVSRAVRYLALRSRRLTREGDQR